MMTEAIRIIWRPDPPLKNHLLKIKKSPPLRQLEAVMLKLTQEAHLREGLKPRWKKSRAADARGGLTGRESGTLMNGWRPQSTRGVAKIVNPTAYALDFYEGHPARTKSVPAHQRKTKKGFVTVRAHTRRERAQIARPIRWTPKYIKKIEQVYLNAIR